MVVNGIELPDTYKYSKLDLAELDRLYIYIITQDLSNSAGSILSEYERAVLQLREILMENSTS